MTENTAKKRRKNRIIIACVAVSAVIVLSVFTVFFVNIQNEKQAVVDYCRSHLGTIIVKDAVTYKGYAAERGMDRFAVSYNAADYFPDDFANEDIPPQAEGVFYVQKEKGTSLYRVFTENNLTTDADEVDYQSFLIADDASALAFADQLMRNAEESFSCDVYPYTEVIFDDVNRCYVVSRSDDKQSGYTLELWLNESGKLTVKNVQWHGQPLQAAFVSNDDEAMKLADIVMCSAYEDAAYIYPDINAYTENGTEWYVLRNDGGFETDGAGVCVTVCADGTVCDLTFGGE